MNWLKMYRWLIVPLLLAALAVTVRGEVYISEFMASNSSILQDEDDDYSDWIELFNAGDRAVDLKGWSLTDDAEDLTKWQFPSYRLVPGEFLIVFASGKNHNEVARELHTNFKLSQDGEYLALVNLYGDVVQEFYPAYPVQQSDIAFGYQFTEPSRAILQPEDDYTYYVPKDDTIDAAWMLPDFDDSDWQTGTGGFGYTTRPSMYDQLINTRVPPKTTSAYVRYEFRPQDEQFDFLGVGFQYDDGFVAYLNGKKIASRNVPPDTKWNSVALQGHTEYVLNHFKTWDITDSTHVLNDRRNVLAVHILNHSPTSTDLLLLTKVEISGGTLRPNVPPTPLLQATPGRYNSLPHEKRVSPVQFSVPHGFYDEPVEVELHTPTRGASIRYTLDCSEPSSENGTLYKEPIEVTGTEVIRALASKSGMRDSDISTRTYIYLEDVIHQSPDGAVPGPGWPTNKVNKQDMDYGMDSEVLEDPRYAPLMTNALADIPSYSLVADPCDLFCYDYGIYVNARRFGPHWEKPVSIELLHPDGTPGFQIDGGVRIRGGHSRWGTNPKHAFRLIFRGAYGHGHLSYPLFGDEGAQEFENIDLRTSQNYSWAFENGERYTMCREVFSRDTQRDMGQPYTRSRACHVYLNGHYWGLFQTQERSEASFAETYFGGHASEYDVIKIRGGIGKKFMVMATDGDLESWQRLWEANKEGFETDEKYYRVLGRDPDGSRNPEYEVLVDPDNLIDYMLCTYYVGDPDGPVNPTYLLPNNFYAIWKRDGTEGFKYFRHDAEHSLDNLYEDRTTNTVLGLDTFRHFNPKVLHERLSEHPDYRQRVADRIHKFFFNDGVLTPEACIARFNERVKEIEKAVIAESARWGDAKSERPRTRDDDWRPAVDWVMEEYMPKRTDIVLEQLKKVGYYPDVEAASFSHYGGHIQPGFQLVMTAPEGKLYFTTDGKDPRLLGGGKYRESSVRRARGGKPIELTIDRTTHVKARVYHKRKWSALTEALFVIGVTKGNLRITELMYNPGIAETSHSFDADDYEFIEVYNAGDHVIDLGGCTFTEGVDFTFPHRLLAPSEFAVICRNADAFRSRYDTSHITIAGEYTRRLNDAGERIQLADAFGNAIVTLTYDDSLPAADGAGYSLTLVNPSSGNPDDFQHEWRLSKRPLGTPGFSDGRPIREP